VTWIDWKRKRCFVEAADSGGRARWHTPGIGGAGFALSRSARDVLLGQDPPVKLTHRAQRVLAETREEHGLTAHPAGTVISRSGMDIRWWTWAGYHANATLAATFPGLTDEKQRFDDVSIRLRTDLTSEIWRAGTSDAPDQLSLPEVDERALAGLKFNEALPDRLAIATLSARLADLDGASTVLHEPARFVVRGQ
jgi:ATP-dependent Lhr-like helicase